MKFYNARNSNCLCMLCIYIAVYVSCLVQIAVCTSDGRRTTERTLSALRLIDDVSAMACGDDHDAECVRHLCDVTGVEPRDAVMIGDTEDDLIMARDAGQ